MPTTTDSVPAAPDVQQQLDIQDFTSYALIIDARSPHEYAEDHLPGAVNLPVVDDEEYAEVGTKHREDAHAAYLMGATYSLKNIASQIGPLISRYKPDDRLLVYCFRGGKRSRVWGDTLRTIGFPVDILPGGWKNYRRWVREGLESLPGQFTYRVLCGPTGCGKTRLLLALRDQGEQILELEGLARHRGSLIGGLPDEPQPTQKLFDTHLVDALRKLDPGRPVWVEAESKKIGNLQLPVALYNAIHRSPTVTVAAPMAERVRLVHEDYAHFARDPVSMVEKLTPLKPLIGKDELDLWSRLAKEGRTSELFERLMVAHYDPCYARSTKRHFVGQADLPLELKSLKPDALAEAARLLAAGVLRGDANR